MDRAIKTLVIHYLFTKTISVNNGKIIISFIDINRVNTHVRRSDMTLTSFLTFNLPLALEFTLTWPNYPQLEWE